MWAALAAALAAADGTATSVAPHERAISGLIQTKMPVRCPLLQSGNQIYGRRVKFQPVDDQDTGQQRPDGELRFAALKLQQRQVRHTLRA